MASKRELGERMQRRLQGEAPTDAEQAAAIAQKYPSWNRVQSRRALGERMQQAVGRGPQQAPTVEERIAAAEAKLAAYDQNQKSSKENSNEETHA